MFSNLKTPLMEHQFPMVRKMWDHHYFIDGDSMGMGKTLCALALAVGTNLPTAVICPAGLKFTWANEIKKHLVEPDFVVLGPNDFHKKFNQKIIILSYSQLGKAYDVLKGRELIIGDEIHYAKNIKAQRTNYLHDILDTIYPQRFVGLTGTLIKNRVPEMYSPLGLCSYNKLGTSGKDILEDFSYTKYCETFCYTVMKKFGRRKVYEYKDFRNEELFATYLKKKYWRRESDEVLDLPPLITKDVMVSYKDDKELAAAWEAHTMGTGEHASTAKKKSALAKVTFTSKYIGDLLDETNKPVVVFSDHPEVLIELEKKLKVSMGVIHGGTPVPQRQKWVELFQAGKLPVIGLTIGAGSTGYTLTASSNLVFNDVAWVPEDNSQAAARIHRIGQNSKSIIHRVLGSRVDLMIVNQLEEKKSVIQRVKELR